jgi:hypothetical protein
MLPDDPPQGWFEMADLRRRRIATAVWVPLRATETIFGRGEINQPGYAEEVFYVSSVAFPAEKRDEAEKLDWHEIGLHQTGPYAFRDHPYKPIEVYQRNDGEDLGIDLCFVQEFSGKRVWHLSQDVVFALGLIQENDEWLRPEEGYLVAARQRRDNSGDVISIGIRSDILRDYLAARRLALRVYYYRSRTAVMMDASHIRWPDGSINETRPHDRFTAGVYAIGADGGSHGAGVAVIHVWRTDVDHEEDVPVFGQENDANTDATSSSYKRGGPRYFRAQGELWRGEWIEPAERSERVRGDAPAETVNFIVDAAGKHQPDRALNSEDVGRYLWFDPDVILTLLKSRDSGLKWHTRSTGSVWSSHGSRVHFGVNRLGLINTYAYDVARLPLWEKKLWGGHNVAPDGAVSTELLDAQMKARPARTEAAEQVIFDLMRMLDETFQRWAGAPLFQAHRAVAEIQSSLHRFRATDRSNLLALAKDIARVTLDRFDVATLRKIAPVPGVQKWGSLKSLEMALATIMRQQEARAMLTPLAGIYELRLGDAHLPSSKIDEAFEMIDLDQSLPLVLQGQQMLERTCNVLNDVGRSIASSLGDNIEA